MLITVVQLWKVCLSVDLYHHKKHIIILFCHLTIIIMSSIDFDISSPYYHILKWSCKSNISWLVWLSVNRADSFYLHYPPFTQSHPKFQSIYNFLSFYPIFFLYLSLLECRYSVKYFWSHHSSWYKFVLDW